MLNEDNGGGIQSTGFSNNDHHSIFQIMDRIMRVKQDKKDFCIHVF
jgi:hypothetical protein